MDIASMVMFRLSACSATRTLNSRSTRSTSSRSCSSSSRYLLFHSTTAMGSMNSVAPEADWSWMMALMRPLNSDLSGST